MTVNPIRIVNTFDTPTQQMFPFHCGQLFALFIGELVQWNLVQTFKTLTIKAPVYFISDVKTVMSVILTYTVIML